MVQTDEGSLSGCELGNQIPSADAAPSKSPAALRALAEAEERRTLRERLQAKVVKELSGREGPEPVRYGDWEVKGIATDF